MSQNQSESQNKMPAEGDFTFIEDTMERTMYKDMYDAVTAAGAWAEMKADPGDGGFMFSGAPVIAKVSAHLNDTVGHSGSSFGITMRTMQRIALIGWNAWVWERKPKTQAIDAIFASVGQNPYEKCPHGLPTYSCMPCSH